MKALNIKYKVYGLFAWTYILCVNIFISLILIPDMYLIINYWRGRRGHIVIGFTATFDISAYHH